MEKNLNNNENNNFQKDKNKNKNKQKEMSLEKLTKISKQMTFILRHKAKDFGLNIEPSGFVKLDELLSIQMLKSHKLTLEMVKEIVAKDSKQRFSLENRPPYFIRANQGHSMKDVKNEECLETLSNYADFQCVVHGTNKEAWEKIKLSGLNKMNRNCIHFAIGYPKDKEVISGMRFSCDVFIEINIIRAVENQIPFYISGNKVILSPGINGVLPFEFFSLAKTSKNEILYAQNYDVVVHFLFKTNNANEIENILVIVIKNETFIKELNFSESVNEIAKLDKLTDYLIENKLFTEKIIITFSSDKIDNYNHLISNNLKDLRYKSFFMIYITLEKDFNQKSLLIHLTENKAKLSSENAKRLLVSASNDIKTVEESELNNEMSEDNMIVNEINKAINFNEKVFLMLDLILQEDSDLIYAIDFILFKPLEIENNKINSFEFDSKSNKDNLIKFIEALNNLLTQSEIKQQDFFTVISLDVLEKLKRIAKQNLINLPKYLNKNLFIFDKHHIELANGDLSEKAKIFTFEYLNNQRKLNTIKLIRE